MRHAGLLIASLIVVLSCTRGSSSRPGKPAAERFREDLHCTERPPGGEEECRAKGCWLGPPRYQCRGNQPSDRVLEEERRAHAEGSVTCVCKCPWHDQRCPKLQ